MALAIPNIAPQQVVNFMWYIGIGIFSLIIMIVVVVKIYQRMTYKYLVYVYKKVGDTQIIFEDWAKQIKNEGNFMFHYRKMNKYSPVVDSKYFRIAQKPLFGLFPGSKLSFNVFLQGESLFPMKVSSNPGLTPINLDLFNYMQQRLKASQAKYQKTNMLLQLLPYMAVGGVILMFIVGMIFYTKHIENISGQILQASREVAQNIIQSGGAQVIQ